MSPRTPLALDIACDLPALAVEREFDILLASDSWRASVSFETVVASLTDAPRRDRMLRRFAAADEQHDHRIGELYEAVIRALGLRPTSRDALLDVAHCARLLDRGLAQGVTSTFRCRRRRRMPEVLTGPVPEPVSVDLCQTSVSRISLDAALAALSPRQRAVLVLWYYEDLT